MTSMTFISLFRYFTKVKYFNQWLIYLIDLMFSCSSTLLSLGLVSFVLAQNYTLYIYGTALFASILCSAVSFVCFKSYKGVIRYSTFTEVGRILLVTLLKIALLIPVIVYLPTILTFREILLVNLIDLFLTFFLLTFLDWRWSLYIIWSWMYPIVTDCWSSVVKTERQFCLEPPWMISWCIR